MNENRRLIERLRTDWQRLQEQQASLAQAYLMVLSAPSPSREQLEGIKTLMDVVSAEIEGLRIVIGRLLAQ
jgi:hypothetical protein